MHFRKFLSTLFCFKQKVNIFDTEKTSLLQTTFVTMQLVNLVTFPFPVRWIQQYERYKVSKPLLKLYWLVIAYKVVHITFLTTMATLNLYSEHCQCDHISIPVLITTIAGLTVSTVADLTFILTGVEVVSSFNWSYQMLNNNLANKKIGKVV